MYALVLPVKMMERVVVVVFVVFSLAWVEVVWVLAVVVWGVVVVV
jgi:hypothetical protein